MDVVETGARRVTKMVLRSRIVDALSEFVATRRPEEWTREFTSSQLHLVIDDHYSVSITAPAKPAGPRRFSVPLGSLNLDPWAVGLGGTVRHVALEMVAEAVLRDQERPGWWVP